MGKIKLKVFEKLFSAWKIGHIMMVCLESEHFFLALRQCAQDP
jgi:hypothetical protein